MAASVLHKNDDLFAQWNILKTEIVELPDHHVSCDWLCQCKKANKNKFFS